MILGQRITGIRKQKGLSQAALGKMIGTSGDVVGRYERGDIKPSIEVAVKIASALEVSLDYLAGQTSLEIDQQAPQGELHARFEIALVACFPIEGQ